MTGKKVLARRTVHAYPFRHRMELREFSDERQGGGRCSFCEEPSKYIEYDCFKSNGHGSGVAFYALCRAHVRLLYPSYGGSA